MTEQAALDDALARARAAGATTEQARQQMLASARERQQAIAEAVEHASVRRVAAALGCSAAVVHAAVRAARRAVHHPG